MHCVIFTTARSVNIPITSHLTNVKAFKKNLWNNTISDTLVISSVSLWQEILTLYLSLSQTKIKWYALKLKGISTFPAGYVFLASAWPNEIFCHKFLNHSTIDKFSIYENISSTYQLIRAQSDFSTVNMLSTYLHLKHLWAHSIYKFY